MFDTLGIDIGAESVKLALLSGGRAVQTAELTYPEEYFSEGWVTDPARMGQLLREKLRALNLRVKRAAVQLPGEVSYVHTATMPAMNEKQLRLNLRFAFTDYISDNLDHYAFDYAMISTPKEVSAALAAAPKRAESEEEGESGAGSMDFLAVAAPLSLLAQVRRTMESAGLTLQKAAPPECSCLGLIQAAPAARGADPEKEYCVLDLGERLFRLYIFKGERHIVTRVLETGMRSLYERVARYYHITREDARARYRENRDGCQTLEGCKAVYGDFSVELMRTLNFYRFSHQDSTLEDVWLIGGGAGAAPLAEAVAGATDMKLHPAPELVPGGENIENCAAFAQAVGAALY